MRRAEAKYFSHVFPMILATLLLGCSGKPESPPQEIRSVRASRRDIVRQCREDGVIRAIRSLDIQAPSGEVLMAVEAEEGGRVRKDEVLARFDTSRLDREIRVLEARALATELRLDLLRRQRDEMEPLVAEGRLADARRTAVDAEMNAAIQQDLVAAGLAPSNDLSRALTQLESSRLNVRLAEERIRDLEEHDVSPEIAEMEASLRKTRGELERARRERGKCTVTAPFDGTVMRVSEIVKRVNAPLEGLDLRLSPHGDSLVSIADISKVRVEANFFEDDVAELRLGQRAVVTARHVPDRQFEGEVVRIGQVGRVLGRTATLTVEVEVANPDRLLRPGLVAQISIVVNERSNVLALPVQYVHGTPEESFVWVVDEEGERRKTSVRTGLSDGDYIEILDGLGEDDLVVMG